jgi:hypothetical protein
LGGGIFGSDLSGAVALTFLQSAPAPSYGAALERRVSTRTWFAVNVVGAFESHDAQLILSSDAVGGRTQVKIHTGTVALMLGTRYVFARGVVDVSLYSSAFASYQAVGGDRLRTGESVGGPDRGKNRALGVTGGLAVERNLVDALALRLSVETLTASLASFETDTLDSAGVEKHTELGSRRVALVLRPGLQLYFYF